MLLTKLWRCGKISKQGENEMFYFTDGSVRGSCEHKHKTIETAQRCLDSDHIGCHYQGGYSDRSIYSQDGDRVELIGYGADDE